MVETICVICFTFHCSLVRDKITINNCFKTGGDHEGPKNKNVLGATRPS